MMMRIGLIGLLALLPAAIYHRSRAWGSASVPFLSYSLAMGTPRWPDEHGRPTSSRAFGRGA